MHLGEDLFEVELCELFPFSYDHEGVSVFCCIVGGVCEGDVYWFDSFLGCFNCHRVVGLDVGAIDLEFFD